MVKAMKKTMKKTMKKVLVDRSKSGKFAKVDYNKRITINGKKYDKMMIVAAKSAVKGRGDGRISDTDVEMIAKACRPGGMGKDKKGKEKAKGNAGYDKVEKATMAYIRKNFKFTAKGDARLRKFIR